MAKSVAIVLVITLLFCTVRPQTTATAATSIEDLTTTSQSTPPSTTTQAPTVTEQTTTQAPTVTEQTTKVTTTTQSTTQATTTLKAVVTTKPSVPTTTINIPVTTQGQTTTIKTGTSANSMVNIPSTAPAQVPQVADIIAQLSDAEQTMVFLMHTLLQVIFHIVQQALYTQTTSL